MYGALGELRQINSRTDFLLEVTVSDKFRTACIWYLAAEVYVSTRIFVVVIPIIIIIIIIIQDYTGAGGYTTGRVS